MQTGTVGAATSAAALIPGFGSLASFTLGVVTDVGVTLRLQSELVLEIAAAHEHTLYAGRSAQRADDRHRRQHGHRTAGQPGQPQDGGESVAERFAGRAFVKAIPFVGIAISAGANILMTYVIGKRANAYFRLGPDAVGDWIGELPRRDRRRRAQAGWLARRCHGGRWARWLGERALQRCASRRRRSLCAASRGDGVAAPLWPAARASGDGEQLVRQATIMFDKFLKASAAAQPVTPRARTAGAATAVIDVTDADFDTVVEQSPLPAVVDFWAEWCEPCHVMSAYVGFLAQDYAGRVLVAALDVDENPETPARFNVMGLPTLLILRDGQEVDRIVGVTPYDEIKERVDHLLVANNRLSESRL